MNVAIIEYYNPYQESKNSLTEGTSSNNLVLKTNQDSFEKEIIIFPLNEDIQPVIETEFASPRDFAPPIFESIENLTKLGQSFGNKRSTGSTLTDLLDVPLWKSTKPLSIDLKVQLFTETNPFNDVLRPAQGLMASCMLTVDPNDGKTFLAPGVGFQNLKKAVRSEGEGKTAKKIETVEGDLSKESKLISIEIPGIFYLEYAFIEKCTPVFSADITASGLPLWCDLTLTIRSVRPANSNMFGYTNSNGKGAEASTKFKKDLENSQSIYNTGFGV